MRRARAAGRQPRPDAGTPAPRGLAARRGALHLLTDVLDRGRMLEEAGLERAGLESSPAERAEAHALAGLTLRRLGQIDDLLSRLVERAPKPPVDHVLRLMAAELVFAERAPHAAVDMAVRLVKSAGAPRMAGLVNAVGRRIAAEGAGVVATQDAALLNTPVWLAERLAADWGEEAARAIATAHLTPPPLDLTPRNPADAAALAEELGATILPTGTLRMARAGQVSALPGYAEGAWWVQDAASALPVRLMGEVAGRRVLDLCAAPGIKTLQLASLGARVTALDISERRMGRVVENLARTGLEAETVVADALEWTPEAPFEAILLDAPCSATGTLRRHADLARRPAPDVAGLADLQRRLMTRAWDWLAPGGRLVLCTCSLLRAEGEAQAAALRTLERGAEGIAPDDPDLAPFLDRRGCLRTRPDQWAEHGHLDGFFAAAFRRA